MVGIDNKFDKYYLLHFFNPTIIPSYSNYIANDNHSGSFKLCHLLFFTTKAYVLVIAHHSPSPAWTWWSFPRLPCPCHLLSPFWVAAHPPAYLWIFSLPLNSRNGVPLRDSKVNLKLVHQLKPLGIYFLRN